MKDKDTKKGGMNTLFCKGEKGQMTIILKVYFVKGDEEGINK